MNLPSRKNLRLKEYDYSTPGAYFVTICTKNRESIFGEIQNNIMRLNNLGKIVEQEILKIESHYKNIRIEKHIVMPNHVHMLVSILETEGINPFPTIQYDLPNVVGKFKAGVSRIVGNALMHSAPKNFWQSSFHDHIVRGKEDYLKIWNYIDTNPLKWEDDCFYNA